MKALLVVDIHGRFTKGKKVYEEKRFIETVNRAIETFRQAGDLIVQVHHLNEDTAPGTPGWEFDPRIQLTEDDPIVYKRKGSAFNGTSLHEILDKHTIDEVIVCGLATQYCIRSTCIGSVKEGYQTRLLKNGTTNWAANPQHTLDRVEAELADLGVVLVE